jgi:antitoxin (DNA-binding transcriptional repressor) of toxin-antitoxin stability system
VNVRTLRANLAAALRQAAAGERIVVTVDGRAVAQLGPLEAAAADDVTIDELAARGLVVAARRGDRPEPDVVLYLRAGSRLDRLVGEVRS